MHTLADPVLAFHITDITNLASIVQHGLYSDIRLGTYPRGTIGYSHIKLRRMTEIRVACCGGQFVGAFVPFYFCPRSPMLYTVNAGNTGLPSGCQKDIVHLVTTVPALIASGQPWAFSDGNAGAYHAAFYNDLGLLPSLDWPAIRATSWKGMTHQKSAEFLVQDYVSWQSIHSIGCYDDLASARVNAILAGAGHRPPVTVKRSWYY